MAVLQHHPAVSGSGSILADDRQRLVKQHLEKLKAQRGVLGAVLLSRDGLPLAEALNRPLNRELFSAMSATIMGAAEMALSSLGELQIRQVTADAGDLRLIVVGTAGENLLAILAERTVKPEDAERFVGPILEDLAAVLKP